MGLLDEHRDPASALGQVSREQTPEEREAADPVVGYEILFEHSKYSEHEFYYNVIARRTKNTCQHRDSLFRTHYLNQAKERLAEYIKLKQNPLQYDLQGEDVNPPVTGDQ